MILESLRLHPIMHVNLRECTNDTTIVINDKQVKIERGTTVVLDIYDIQRDHAYFGSDAETFDPDRFNEENGGFKNFMDQGFIFPFGMIIFGVNSS